MDGFDQNLIDEIDNTLGLPKQPKAPKPPTPKPVKVDGADVASVLDDEFAKLGYSPTARLSLLGDIGRENAWNRNTIFGGHSDPKNKAFNRGIVSWQGSRRTNLDSFLQKEGVYGRNDDDELRGMARFMDNELRSSFPQQFNRLKSAQTTAEASEALRQYIKYVPTAPYNTPDNEFGVKNNRQWAEKARQLGLAQPQEDYSGLIGEIDTLLGSPDNDVNKSLIGEIDSVLGTKPPVTNPNNPIQPLAKDILPAYKPNAPLPESAETLEQQFNSALLPGSPRSAVLVTKGATPNPLLLKNKNFDRIRLPEGELFVNKQKIKTPRAFVKKNGFASLIGKVENIPDTTQSPLAVRTEDANGKELTTSGVSPQNLQAQAQTDAAQFPNAATQKVVTPGQAVTERAQTDLQKDTQANYQEFLKASGLANNQQSVDEYNRLMQLTTDSANEANRAAVADYNQNAQRNATRQNVQRPVANNATTQPTRANNAQVPLTEQPTQSQPTQDFQDLTVGVEVGKDKDARKATNNAVIARLGQMGYDAQDVEEVLKRADLSGDDEQYSKESRFNTVIGANFIRDVERQKQKRIAGQQAARSAILDFIASGRNLSDADLAEFGKQGIYLSDLDPNELAEAQELGKSGKQRQTEIFGQYREQGDTSEMARLKTQRDLGWISPAKFTELSNKEIEAEEKLKKGIRDQYSVNEGDTRAFNVQPDFKQINKELDSLLEGQTAVDYVNEQARIEKEYKNRPLARPLEFAKNFYKAVPKAISSVLKTSSIATELANAPMATIIDAVANTDLRKSLNADNGFGMKAGKYLDDFIEKNAPANKDFRNEFFVTTLPDTLGQLAIQIGLGAATGGATLPTALGSSMGASQQYEEAGKFTKDQNIRLLAAVVGGGLASSDALIFNKWFKTASSADKTGFFNNLKASVLKRLGANVGEKEAAEIADLTAQSFMQKALQYGKGGINEGLKEGVQEVSENKGNDALAAATYDKSQARKDKIFSITDDDIGSFLGGFIGGTAGSAVQTKLEQGSIAERLAEADKITLQIDELVANNKITPEVAEQAKTKVDEIKNKPAFEIRRDNRIKELGYSPEEIADMSGVEKQEIISLNENLNAPTSTRTNIGTEKVPALTSLESASPSSDSSTATSTVFSNQTTGGASINPQLLERMADSAISDIKPLSDVANTDTFIKQGLGGFDIPSQRVVMANVVDILHNDKVRDFVVKFIPVDVVDNFISSQNTTKKSLHNNAMLKPSAPIDLNLPIPIAVDTATSIIRLLASDAAKQAIGNTVLSFDGRRSAEALSSTSKTSKLNRHNINTPVIDIVNGESNSQLDSPPKIIPQNGSKSKQNQQFKANEKENSTLQKPSSQMDTQPLAQDKLSENPDAVSVKSIIAQAAEDADKGAGKQKFDVAQVDSQPLVSNKPAQNAPKIRTRQKLDKAAATAKARNVFDDIEDAQPTQPPPSLTKGDTVTVKGKTAKVKKVSKDGKKAVIDGGAIVDVAKVEKVKEVADVKALSTSEQVSPNANPTVKETKESVKKEKINPRTGLTETQTEYLAKELQQTAYARLKEEGAEVNSPDFKEKFGDFPSKTINLSIENGEFIKVPGDGQFKVTSIDAANRLHQKITGKPIPLFEKTVNASIPRTNDEKDASMKRVSTGKPSKQTQEAIEKEQSLFELASGKFDAQDFNQEDYVSDIKEVQKDIENKIDSVKSSIASIDDLTWTEQNYQRKVQRLENETIYLKGQLQKTWYNKQDIADYKNDLNKAEKALKQAKKSLKAEGLKRPARLESYKKELARLEKVLETFDSNPLLKTSTEFDSAEFERELEAIQPVRNDKGELLAPNGKVSNLKNERLWKTVRSGSFKEWFGDWENDAKNASKVVDENGEPKMVWHGTDANIEAFDIKTKGKSTDAISAKSGFWFVDSPDIAADYANYAAQVAPVAKLIRESEALEKRQRWDEANDKIVQAEELENEIDDNRTRGQNVLPVFLNIRQMASMDAESETFSNSEQDINRFILRSRVQGDGAYIANLDDSPMFSDRVANHYLIFKPNQVKSLFNIGSFDTEQDSILLKQRDNQSTALTKSLAKSFKTADVANVTATNTGLGVEVNEQGAELLKRAMRQAGYKVTSFDGAFNNPAQTQDILTALEDIAVTMESLDIDTKGIDNLIDAVEDYAKDNNGVATVYLYDDAIPHEKAHEVMFQNAIDKNNERMFGNADTLKDATFNKAKKALDKLSKRGLSDGEVLQEMFAYITTADHLKLGLTAEEAGTWYHNALKQYVETNGENVLNDIEKWATKEAEIYDQIEKVKSKSAEVTEAVRGESENTQTESDESARADRPLEESRTENERIAEVTGETEKQIQTKNRQFAKSIANSFYDIGNVEYEAQSEVKWLKQSQKDIDSLGVDDAIKKYDSLDPKTSEGYKTALGVAIASELYANGDTNAFTSFGRKLTEDIGNIAQELRATQLLARLSPEHAVMAATAKREKALGRALTEEEANDLRAVIGTQAEALKEVSDNLDTANAMLDEHQAQISQYEKLEQDLRETIAKENEKATNLSKDLTVAKRLATYYKNLVEGNKPKTGKRKVSEITKRVEADKNEILKRIRERFKSNPLLMVAGEKGASNLSDATIRLQNLSVAREMEKAGKDAKTIWLATGWEKGGDGKWKTEIHDDFTLNVIPSDKISVKLSEILNDKELFNAYPELTDIRVSRTRNGNYFAPELNTIRLSATTKEAQYQSEYDAKVQEIYQQAEDLAKEDKLTQEKESELWSKIDNLDAILAKSPTIERYNASVLRHEIQHAIQRIEGFAKGGSRLQFEDSPLANYGLSGTEAFAKYLRLGGEVEARNVQTRLNMSAEERAQKPLAETEDVARESQIYLQNALKSQSNPLLKASDLDEETFKDLTDVAVYKLDKELATGFTPQAFDTWLDTLTSNELTQYQKDLIHAEAWSLLTGESKGQTAEQKVVMKNRLEHAKRANVILKANEAKVKADTDSALKNDTAFRNDKFAKEMFALAKTLDVSPEGVTLAYGIREVGETRALKEMFKELFPDSNFGQALTEGRSLLDNAREHHKRALMEVRKGGTLTDEAYQKLLLDKRDAEKMQRKKRQELERLLKELEYSKGKKMLLFAEKLYNIPRSLGFSADAGFLGRQGGKAFFTNNKAWRDATKVVYPALFNQEQLDNLLHEMYKSDMRQRAEARGMKFKEIGDRSYVNEDWANSLFEEGFDWKANEPGIKRTLKKGVNAVTFIPRRSNRAHGAFLDTLRLKIFEDAFNKLEKMNLTEGEKVEAEEFFAKKFAPILTGQGYGGDYDNVLNFLARVPFAAPRLRLSHFQFLYYMNPVRAAFLPKGARKIVFEKQLKFYAPVGMIVALGLLSGLMGDDPEDSDFLKIKGDKLAEWTGWNGFKDMRFDLSGGGKEPQRAVTLGFERLIHTITGKKKEANKIDQELFSIFVAQSHWGKDGKENSLGSFWRYALHPSLGIGIGLTSGKDAVGQPYNGWKAARDVVLPLPAREVIEAGTYKYDQTKFDTATRLFFSFVPNQVGVGTQSFRKKTKEPKK